MRELIKRGLSGLLYISVLLFCIFSSENTFLLLFLFLGLVCLSEYLRLISYRFWHPYLLLIAGLVIFSYYKVNRIATYIYLALTLLTSLYLIRNLIRLKVRRLTRSYKLILTLFYMVGGFVFLTLIPSYQDNFNPEIVAGIFALIWINDSFAFLVGKSIGKRKLFASVSPKKTIEGFLGGLLFAMLGSYFIVKFTDTLDLTVWLVLSIIVSCFGTLGDLIESKFKREAHVKDSGIFLPGHGGLYDRLDSLLFASPFIYLTLLIAHYVS
ncbi:phosphatidate cytidylyltransferase [Croceiramulus getboli]|nr:phosphatidate cytidylyltransferase [Flavobacteriaceae bacterium YJPT1-3]